MKYNTILFDVDDTLFDFGISEEMALSKTFMEFELPRGLADYHASYKQISKVLWQELEQGNKTLPELGVERFNRLFNKHRININPEKFSNSYLKNLGEEVHPIEGAEELCQSLSNFRLAIITNGFATVQRSRIELSPFTNVFEHIITSEEAGAQKPTKEIFEYAFSKLLLTDKSKVLIVGDSLSSDIQGGNNFGISTCWFNSKGKENDSGIKRLMKLVS